MHVVRIERVLLPLALALLGSAGPSWAVTPAEVRCRSPLPIDRFGTEDGLSHNAVFAIAQDRLGFLWIGTQGGLDRWDGTRVVSYRPSPGADDGLGSSVVQALLEDREGRLWVGTAAGLFRLGADRRGFETIRLPLASDRVRDLAEDDSGSTWVATETGVARFEAGAGPEAEVITDGPPDSIYQLVLAGNGEVWAVRAVSTEAGLVRLGERGIEERIAVGLGWFAATETRGGRILIDPRAAPAPKRHEEIVEVVDPEHQGTSVLLEDTAGRLWMATYRGLYVREPTGSLCRVGSDPGAPHRLYDEINALFEDRDGAVWIGTYGGLLRYDPHRKPFEHLPATEPSPAYGPLGGPTTGEPLSSVAIEPDDSLWVGTYGNGLLRLDPRSGFRLETLGGDRSDCSDYIWDLEIVRSGDLWVGTSEGVCVLDRAARRLRRVRVDSDWVRDFEQDAAGTLWMAGATGLLAIHPVEREPRPVVAGESTGIFLDTVHVDGDGVVWGAGGLESGTLLRHAPGEPPWVRVGFLPEGIWDLHRDRDGRLWLATGLGLRRLDESTPGEYRALPVADVPSTVIYSLREDARGRLWAGTSRGILRYDPNGRSPTRLFDLQDGTGSLEFNRHAAAKEGDSLYFAGMRGLTRFRPDAIQGNRTVPPVAISNIRILSGEGERHPNPFITDRVILEPADTTLEVEFVALAFTQPSKNRYRYRLEGFDGAWVEAGSRGFARYTGLDPGRYVFHASGSNADGVWNESGVALPIVVRPAIWETLWFRALAVLSLAATLFAWHRRRIGRLLEMERLRVRIASDLHDDLSSDLSGVALAAESVARRRELTDEDRTRLGQVRDTALTLVDGVRDIVWAINPEHDTMEATVRKMRQVARDLLVECDWSFEASPAARSGGIDMTHRRDLLLIFKESLHNVVRHARAARVDVDLEMEGPSLRLRVTDDGVGFDPATVEAGNGLASIRRRAAVMGAELDLWSRPGRGTRLILRIPKTRDGPAHSPAVSSGHS
jgi:ligand-binding sensor domain-containing protein/signal transduction histidine kinase